MLLFIFRTSNNFVFHCFRFWWNALPPFLTSKTPICFQNEITSECPNRNRHLCWKNPTRCSQGTSQEPCNIWTTWALSKVCVGHHEYLWCSMNIVFVMLHQHYQCIPSIPYASWISKHHEYSWWVRSMHQASWVWGRHGIWGILTRQISMIFAALFHWKKLLSLCARKFLPEVFLGARPRGELDFDCQSEGCPPHDVFPSTHGLLTEFHFQGPMESTY